MELIIETTAAEAHPGLNGPALDLLTFLSFGASERYGALHPLSGVANILRRKHNVDLLPLFSFGDAVPEDEEDERELVRLWQEPARLAESCAAAIAAIVESPRLQELARGFPGLLPRLTDLEAIACWAAMRDARVRLTYRLA